MKLTTLKSTLQRAPGSKLQTLSARPMVERKRGSAGVKDRNNIKRRDFGMCQECKRNGIARAGHLVDHRIPLWDGGSDEEENKQSLCYPCHDAKTKVEAGLRARGQSVPRPDGVEVPRTR